MKTRFRELREDNDLTQEKSAQIVYISKKTCIRYEKGERIVPLDVAKRFAEYYKTSIDYISYLTDEEKPYS